MSDYTDHINSLPDSVDKNSVFFFDDDRLEQPYDRFFRFCLENLQTGWPEYDIAHCGFLYRDSEVNNACARRDDDDNPWIEVNKGLFENLFAKFEEARGYIDALPEAGVVSKLSGDEVYYLMFQSATMFLYYHELAHIIQFSGPNITVSEQHVSEQNVDGEDDEYSLTVHALEMDADEFGANFLYNQIAYYFNKVEDGEKTKEILKSLMSTGLASTFLLFEMLDMGIELPMYFDSNSHPDSIIRIVHITGIILDKMKHDYGERFQITSGEVIRRAFEIAGPLLEAPNSLENFFEGIRLNSARIISYSAEMMDERSQYYEMAGIRMQNGN